MRMRTGIAILTACLSSNAWAGGVAPSKDNGGRVENGLIVRPNTVRRPTDALRVPADATGRLIVKLANQADARMRADGRGVISLTSRSLDCVQAVIDQAGLEVRRAFNQNDDKLLALEQKAAALSGYAQPRLPGILYIEGAEGALLQVMRTLNDCPDVDWVQPETRLYMHGGPQTGACCVPSCQICVDDFSADACSVVGGSFLLNTTCAVGDPVLCPTSGACCDEGAGTCADDTDAADCAAVGLRYEPGATCADVNMGKEPCVAVVGACCVVGTCDDAMGDGVGMVDCIGAGGFWFEGGACEVEDCDPDCGSEFAGDCFDVNGNFTDFCDDQQCCDTVCDIDPRCCDTESPFNFWDELCAAQANLLCDFGNGANPCTSFLAGPCFEPAPPGLGGCNEPGCCDTVCDMDPTCCAIWWDENCATAAVDLCPSTGSNCCSGHGGLGCDDADCAAAVCAVDPFCCDISWDQICAGDAAMLCAACLQATTPDLTYAQGYLTGEPYPIKPNTLPVPQCNFVVEDCALFFPEADFGYNGRGFILEVPGNPYGGLYGAGVEIFEEYGIDATGEGVLTKGKTIKVGVIEWGFWEGHEDLDVNIEPGQTLLEIGPLTPEFNHATACLGIINGKDNGFGITGIAPEAEAWFFPLTSVEEGPREPSAWASAVSILGPGDVISCSYGPFPNLNCSGFSWTLIRLASDLGIQVCLSAGNDCFDLGGAEDLGNSGALVVGACSPGLPWYRLAFSNFCVGPAIGRGNIVHVKAWGSNVATTGYGDLFAGDPDDPDPKRRFYTSAFNGTSAAAPQIAGFVACFQGLAKQFYGIPMSTGVPAGGMAQSTQLQSAIGAPGTPPPPSFCELNGGFDGPCGLDVNPDLGPNMIGPFPRGPGQVNTLFAQGGAGFPNSPWLGSPLILRGDHLFGNSFSLANDDNAYLVIESEFTQAGTQPDAAAGGDDGLGDPVDSPIAQILYVATGQLTDLVVTSQEELINPRSGIAVEIESHTSGFFSLLFVELYDWNLNRWMFAGVDVMQPPPVAGTDLPNDTYTSNFAARFFNPDTDEILVRCWTFGFGGAIGNVPGFNIGGKVVIRYDYLNFELTNGFGVVPGP